MADQRVSNILPDFPVSYKPYHEGLANRAAPMRPQGGSMRLSAPMGVGNRFSGDDDVSDDPAWYSAPHGSLQPALPSSILKQRSASSLTSSTDTGASSNPVSPAPSLDVNTSNNADRGSDMADGDDYFPPLPQMHQHQHQQPQRRSMQIPVPMRKSRSSTGKQEVKRLSLEKKPLRDSIGSPSQVTSPRGLSRAAAGGEGRESLSFDMVRESMDLGGNGGVQHASNYRESMDFSASGGLRTPGFRDSMDFSASGGLRMPGYRESMMRYRPSDLNSNDMKKNLMTRDSLAVDPAELFSSSRGSVSHFGARPTEEGLSDFLKAARTGNLMLLKASIQDTNTDFNERDPVHGQTALHIAVRFGQFAAVRLLCQKRCRKMLLDSVDNRQNTPLHLAAAKSRRVTKFLLEQGAAVTLVNTRDQTALGVHILTARRDEPLITEMLLQHKADPNAPLANSTLIHKAVDASLYEIAYRLVRYGARLDIKDEHDKMVFDKVNRKVLRQLFSKISFPPVWVPDQERKTCMLCSRKFNRFNLGIRRHHCRHCGRICCGQCSHVSVESVKFPKTFEDRLKKGSAATNAEKKRVCKTCSVVFKDREEPQEEKNWSDELMAKVVGCTWDEIEGQQNAPRRSSVV